MTAELFDARACDLGEGPLWHPERDQLFWFDILGQKLLSRQGETALDWSFDRPVSAAGWIDRDTLLVAGAGALLRFDIASGDHEPICPLDADRPGNRSNDGRADPWGGFWIGTMGRGGELKAGAIWRYYRGELRRLFGDITIPNAICFAPDGSFAHFADTRDRIVWRQRLGTDGWPVGEREIFLDLRADGANPDGAVCDSEGHLWLARWGGASVARYRPDGRCDRVLEVSATQTTCPAFGGPDLATLYITSAREGLPPDRVATEPQHGATYRIATPFRGQREHAVLL